MGIIHSVSCSQLPQTYIKPVTDLSVCTTNSISQAVPVLENMDFPVCKSTGIKTVRICCVEVTSCLLGLCALIKL